MAGRGQKTGSHFVVHKFGGTSVANAERYRAAAKILHSVGLGARKAVVVSAMSGVTNVLIELTELAKARDDSYAAKAEALKKRHLETLSELLPFNRQGPLVKALDADFSDIKELLRGIWLSRTVSERTVELVSGYGELWSAQFLSAYLGSQGGSVDWLDARAVLTVEPGETAVTVDWEKSRSKTDAWLRKTDAETVVITGFIASTPEGIPTTLKRNGSDFSASIFGALLGASEIVIWTDVDGVLSADPRLVPEAVVLGELSYREATELAYFGAKVVHPSTMAPAIDRQIPIWIKNAFRPAVLGTRIHGAPARSEAPVKGFASIDGMALVNVEGTGMIGVPGVAHRLFGALREVGISVVLISQASSEHSICFAVPDRHAALAKKTVEQAFFAELHHGQIQTVTVTPGCSILAAVGDNMVERPGVAGTFFGALGKSGVNIRAIAQGSSERNISVVVDGPGARRALRAAHSAFYLSNQTVSIGVIGAGLIGSAFLDQLHEGIERLRADFKTDLRVRGVMNSRKMLLSEQQIDLSRWREALEASPASASLSDFVKQVHADFLPHTVLIDCTASAEVPEHYARWLSSGIHVITPNKKAGSGPLAAYRKLKAQTRDSRRHFLYATTVGAGLPVLNTLRDLVQTGDAVIQAEGILSGTLSYIFHSFTGERPFSEIVREAKARGYTEPDPRDDLSGADVARKLVILARETGLALELADVAVQNLVPKALQGGSTEAFLKHLPEHDAAMAELVAKAKASGEVLRYVGRVDAREGKASVQLRAYPMSHPFARILAGDNIVAYTTRRYQTQPLVIQGPGAGPQVTAGGVFADLLRLTAYLGAPL